MKSIKPNILKFAMIFSLAILNLVGCKNAEGEVKTQTLSLPKQRVLIVLRDKTKSFSEFINNANTQVVNIVNNLGPRDMFILIEIKSGFQPQRNVSLQCQMPAVPASLLEPTKKLIEYKRKQAQLDQIWREVGNIKKAIIEWLNKPIELDGTGTDIFRTLEYCSQRLSREDSGKDKYLIAFTDLIDERGGRKKIEEPPSAALDFNAVYANILFVPWQNNNQFQSKELSWRTWFEKQGAIKFSMWEPAESKSQTLIPAIFPPCSVPKMLVSPF